MSLKRQDKLSIAIVGGGIGGICTAIGLRQQGIENITIYEEKPSFTELGAGVALGPNAHTALRLLSPEAYTALQRVRTNNASPELRNTWFTFRRADAHGTAEELFQQYSPVGQSTVHRAKFLAELVSLLPPGIAHFNKSLTHIDQNPNHVVLHFKDSTCATHSALIACDGIHSVVRRQLFPDLPPPEYSGKYAYRGLIPISLAKSALSDPSLADNAQLYVGLHGHILSMPIESRQKLNLVAFATSPEKIWPEKEWIVPATKSDLLADFAGWKEEPIQKLLHLLPDEKLVKWALHDHLSSPLPTYTPHPLIALLGDAAHAMTPHNGTGAGMAIEDAVVLSYAISRAQASNLPICDAFEVYDTLRRERTQKVVVASRRQGEVYDLEAVELEGLEEHIKSSRGWIWGWDGEGEKGEVERLLRERGGRGSAFGRLVEKVKGNI